jgi:predicted TIM-barrel enzyme
LILPVVHHLTEEITRSEAERAIAAGADGLFLISHHGADAVLPGLAHELKSLYPEAYVGINLLSTGNEDAFRLAHAAEIDALWCDAPGVSSAGASFAGDRLANLLAGATADGDEFDIFASVAFKYQPVEPNPPAAAQAAAACGFIATTSGTKTGSPPELSKIVTMSEATGGFLAVASGMTPENIGAYAPYLSHILVSTGISIDENRMNPERLKQFIANARAARG